MIADLSHLGPWYPGESRYLCCPRHSTGALDRMDFDAAWEIARDCPDCEADFEGRAS